MNRVGLAHEAFRNELRRCGSAVKLKGSQTVDSSNGVAICALIGAPRIGMGFHAADLNALVSCLSSGIQLGDACRKSVQMWLQAVDARPASPRESLNRPAASFFGGLS